MGVKQGFQTKLKYSITKEFVNKIYSSINDITLTYACETFPTSLFTKVMTYGVIFSLYVMILYLQYYRQYYSTN